MLAMCGACLRNECVTNTKLCVEAIRMITSHIIIIMYVILVLRTASLRGNAAMEIRPKGRTRVIALHI
jgi:hypothetical protein